MAEKVGFEPTGPVKGLLDFEGHFGPKTAIFRFIASYRITPKTALYQGFRRFAL